MAADQVVDLTHLDRIFFPVNRAARRCQSVDGKRQLELQAVFQTRPNKILPLFIPDDLLQFGHVVVSRGVDGQAAKVGDRRRLRVDGVGSALGKVFEQLRDDFNASTENVLGEKRFVSFGRVLEQLEDGSEEENVFGGGERREVVQLEGHVEVGRGLRHERRKIFRDLIGIFRQYIRDELLQQGLDGFRLHRRQKPSRGRRSQRSQELGQVCLDEAALILGQLAEPGGHRSVRIEDQEFQKPRRNFKFRSETQLEGRLRQRLPEFRVRLERFYDRSQEFVAAVVGGFDLQNDLGDPGDVFPEKEMINEWPSS